MLVFTMGSELGLTTESEPEVKLDGVGIWWTCWTSIWSVILFCGMGYLIWNRHAQVLRIRGIGLSLTAVLTLHLYWLSVQLGYVLGAVTPGDAEFWIMGTYLPLGIALFHASNSRFLYVAKAQQRYLDHLVDGPVESRRAVGILARFKKLDYTSRIVILVGSGMCLQVCDFCVKGRGIALFLTPVMTVVPRHPHVPPFSEVSSLVGHSRHGNLRYRAGADDTDGSGLGVVAEHSLAIRMGLVHRPLYSVEVPQYQRHAWLAVPDHWLRSRRVSSGVPAEAMQKAQSDDVVHSACTQRPCGSSPCTSRPWSQSTSTLSPHNGKSRLL